MESLLEPFATRSGALALAELALLSVAGGLLGTHVVLRRIAFFAHGVGGATYPGVVAAAGLGVPAALGALAGAVAYAGAVGELTRRSRVASDAATALALVAALALGRLLAHDVFPSGVSEEEALVGSVSRVGAAELARSGAAAVLALAATAVLGRRWLATAFDPQVAAGRARGERLAEVALLLVLAAVAVAAVDAVGALLAGALLVVPAATARLLAGSVRELYRRALALGVAESVVSLWLSTRLAVPAGPVLATVSGAVLVAVAAGRSARARTGARAGGRAAAAQASA